MKKYMFENTYILDGKTPVLEPDIYLFSNWMTNADRQVAVSKIGNIHISTVFVGMDTDYCDPPKLFQSMVFGGKFEHRIECYSTWEAAEAGHKAMVKMVEDSQ